MSFIPNINYKNKLDHIILLPQQRTKDATKQKLNKNIENVKKFLRKKVAKAAFNPEKEE